MLTLYDISQLIYHTFFFLILLAVECCMDACNTLNYFYNAKSYFLTINVYPLMLFII